MGGKNVKSGLSVSLDVKEIYGVLCPKCKRKLRELIKEKITDQMVEKIVGGE